MENMIILEVWLLNNWLVNVDETSTDILKYDVLQMTASKFTNWCMLQRSTLRVDDGQYSCKMTLIEKKLSL